MIEIFFKKFKDWQLWLTNSRGNTIIEALCPVESKADRLYISNTTGKETSSFVAMDTKLEARLMRIERNVENVGKSVIYIQNMLNLKTIKFQSTHS